jgi:hypothetical protein
MGQESHDLLGRLQTLLRREVPNGDAGAIFERALRVLHESVEAATFGKTSKRKRQASPSSSTPSAENYETRIRPGADTGRSRHIPRAVKRAVWYRDRGQCAFVAASGVRCAEQEFLELHHIQPYALNGAATVGNIALRCRAHNVFEAEVIFGARDGGPGGRSVASESGGGQEWGERLVAGQPGKTSRLPGLEESFVRDDGTSGARERASVPIAAT